MLQRRQSLHILNCIPTVVYHLAITSKGFPTQWISISVKNILGYAVEAALAPDWWINCLHPDDKEAAVKKTSILMTQGHLVQEYRFRAKGGHYLWIRDEASLLRDAAGRPKEIVGFWINITERKQAEEQAEQARDILNSIPTIFYDLAITPKSFPTKWISDSVTKILGYEVGEALAPDWWIDCLHPDDREAAVKKTSILMTQGYLVQEYRFRAKDGRYFWVRDEASLLRDADGRPKEIIGFWTSITERKKAEDGRRKRSSKSSRGAS